MPVLQKISKNGYVCVCVTYRQGVIPVYMYTFMVYKFKKLSTQML